MKILKIVAVLVLVFFGVAFYLDVNTPPQPTRAELIAPLLEPHRLLSDEDALKATCKNAPEVMLEWMYQGTRVKTVVPCQLVVFTAGGKDPSVTFWFKQEWLSNVPDNQAGCFDGMSSYLEMPPYGELGMGCKAITPEGIGGTIKYRESILADPNNFLNREWLESVVIATTY